MIIGFNFFVCLFVFMCVLWFFFPLFFFLNIKEFGKQLFVCNH